MEPARNNLDFWMPNCTASLAASQSPNPHCSTLHLRFGSIGATKSTAHLNPKMSNYFLADPYDQDVIGPYGHLALACPVFDPELRPKGVCRRVQAAQAPRKSDPPTNSMRPLRLSAKWFLEKKVNSSQKSVVGGSVGPWVCGRFGPEEN